MTCPINPWHLVLLKDDSTLHRKLMLDCFLTKNAYLCTHFKYVTYETGSCGYTSLGSISDINSCLVSHLRASNFVLPPYFWDNFHSRGRFFYLCTKESNIIEVRSSF